MSSMIEIPETRLIRVRAHKKLSERQHPHYSQGNFRLRAIMYLTQAIDGLTGFTTPSGVILSDIMSALGQFEMSLSTNERIELAKIKEVSYENYLKGFRE